MIEIMSTRYEAGALLAAKRWHRMVVDITSLRSRFAALELFDFARSLSADLPESVRIALVARSDQAKQARLIERIARNGGLALAFFLDVEAATIWVTGMNPHGRIKPQLAGNPVKL